MNFKSLKFRINMMTIIYSIIIIAISSSMMYTIVSKLISKRLDEENVEHLKDIQISIENDIKKLDSISMLFTPFGNMGESMLRFNQIQEVGEKSILMTKIKADMNVIDFSNPDISLCVFFVNDQYTDFIATSNAVDEIDFQTLPILFETATNTFYGPHRTAMTLESNMVISLKRNVNMGTNLPTFAYVECDFENTLNAMKNYLDSEAYINILTNHENRIVYSSDETRFKLGDIFDDTFDDRVYAKYESDSKYPLRVITIMDYSQLRNLRKDLIFNYLIQYPVFLIAGIVFSLILVNVIARPLHKFQEGIIQMEKGDFDTLITKTNIHEFDTLIAYMHKAKLKISMLLDEVREKEQKSAFAEISRLRAQISPHFLLNTLNTIHWMAIEQKQPSIDNIVMSLTKILSYNLKNDDFKTAIGEELEATEQYLKLQQLKYELSYRIINEAGEEVLQYEMPRFVLQPLVENSILHGKSEFILIEITMKVGENGIVLTVRDNGGKIIQERLNYINNHLENPEKLGIGLSYVFSALRSYYKRDDLITVTDIQTGLEISILLPFEGGDFFV